MPPVKRTRVARGVGFVLASLPICFGALRALTSGTDFRYLVTAFASLVAGWAAFRFTAGRMRSRWARSLLALALSTVAGALAAVGQGASSIPAVLTVTGGFAVCVTLGGMLGVFSKSSPPAAVAADEAPRSTSVGSSR